MPELLKDKILSHATFGAWKVLEINRTLEKFRAPSGLILHLFVNIVLEGFCTDPSFPPGLVRTDGLRLAWK